jgi:NADP-dependent 3-hydroxy acid dehydrogenase YdfG
MLVFSSYQKDITRLFQDGLDLERLRDKTILVVGATGLVGGCIVDVLMQNPARCYKVIAAGRNKERAQQKFAAYWEDESFFFAKIDATRRAKSGKAPALLSEHGKKGNMGRD